ncbi:MAG: zinc carboxypeptidase [Idiomarinaceae bacterium HL-53]|nr:MAG: zinc carboxypeptidase [Idiomarinaceae bacterium HL-53]CUS49025.1 Murein tripeptide amidase MpaA [Idiomarinaceae bacterium HL-53]
MHISSQFDSGNIEVIELQSPENIRLNIRADKDSEFYQWFHFKLHTQAMQAHRLLIENASGAAYPDGWQGYQALASYDREEWFRVPTDYDGKILTIEFTPEQESIYFAYFVPYSWERHLDLLQWAQQSAWVSQVHLGDTLDQREMSVLVIGEPVPEKKSIWMTARQHPGESMAEWFVEGLLEHLLDDQEPLSRVLLDKVVFYIVPNMNPDGSVRGHLRTNAVGTNLNREWATPSLEKSPEVFHVLNKMNETGVDMYLDIHGDEAIPYNFVAGCEGIPSYDDRHQQLEDAFKQAYARATPEFQDVHGYAKDKPGEANMTVASAAVGERFKCLAYTVEMPFKDNDGVPNPYTGWNDTRAKQFGRDTLRAIAEVVDQLR